MWAKGDVTGLSRTCRGRHGEVGIVEFVLKRARGCLSVMKKILYITFVSLFDFPAVAAVVVVGIVVFIHFRCYRGFHRRVWPGIGRHEPRP